MLSISEVSRSTSAEGEGVGALAEVLSVHINNRPGNFFRCEFSSTSVLPPMLAMLDQYIILPGPVPGLGLSLAVGSMLGDAHCTQNRGLLRD